VLARLVPCVALILAVAACGPTTNESPAPSSAASSAMAPGSFWAIIADAFEGPDRRAAAEIRRDELVDQTGLSGWWIHSEGERAMVVFGRYAAPSDPQAREDLTSLKAMVDAGRFRPRTLMLTPVQTGTVRSAPGTYELSRARGKGAYTLQIGFCIDDRDRQQAAEASEQWVQSLRKEGVQAFYHHGPNRSIVTVGIFDESAAWVNAQGIVQYSQAVRSLQEQFPYNLRNGETIIIRVKGKPAFKQPSFLVRIPQS
jgi:hypothetical protein